MIVTNDVKYIGVTDHTIDLFEGQYVVEEGMLYNSYVILDEKVCVLDTTDQNYKEEWLRNLEEALDGRKPDYLVVSHMEPDHSSAILAFMEKYPEARILGSTGAFNMMKNLFGTDFPERKMVTKEKDVLDLGKHKLSFIAAPLVHWPEVLMSYDMTDGILFSADGFGKFGAQKDTEDWACEARRYYFGIVGKFGQNVQNVLKKASGLDIRIICPLHGPVLKENLGYYLSLYDTWSSYRAEDLGVTICYSSVYGHTKEACLYLAKRLEEQGTKASLFDLARDDSAEAVEDAFRYDRLVLATTTYNGDFFPVMKDFIHHLLDHNYQNRTIAFIENGMWAPMAAKGMKALTDTLKDITYASTVTIRGAVTESVREALDALALELK